MNERAIDSLMVARPRRGPAPWVFSLLILPVGIVVGIKFTPLPFLLARAGVPVDRIAIVSSLVNLPGVLVFLWAPLVDIKLRRRTWLALASLATALSVCIYVPLIGASHLTLMTAAILAGGVADSLVLAACGGLMVKTLPQLAHPRGSAWWQAGFLGGGALGGAALLWLANRLPLSQAALWVAVPIALPAVVALTIPEAPPPPSPWFEGRLPTIGSELWAIARSPGRRWSTVLLLAPGGTGAAQSLLPAIAAHYGVGDTGVMWANGLGGGLVLAIGSLGGALIPGDWDPRVAYVVAGLTNAFAALCLMAANLPWVYLAGTVLYLATEGFCWARFTALVVDIVGKETTDASTVFSVLSAAGSIPILYMIWLDGVGYRLFGQHGLLWTDAGANLLVGVVVLTVFLGYGLRFRRAAAD